ncbi:MAG: hypothetical protein ABEI39_04720 [Halobacteriales archaeon]
MTRFPRADRNTRLECGCGAPVVKRGSKYICVGCGEELSEDEAQRGGPEPTP